MARPAGGTTAGDATVPPPPPEAAAVFTGPAMDMARAYVSLLATRGVAWGVVGPGEGPRLWDRHLLNCGVAADLIGTAGDVVDVGSGAGLPGVVWAIRRPGARVVLVEPMARRARFLRECVAELGLSNVTVLRSRAEDLAGSVQAEVVTARAVAPLDRLARLLMPIVTPGGVVLALKGRRAAAELTRAAATLRGLGAGDARVVTVGQGIVEPPTTVIRFRAAPVGCRP